MKLNVYAKVLFAFVIVAFLFIIGFFYYMQEVIKTITINSQNVITSGVIATLEQELQRLPKSNLESAVKKKNHAFNLVSEQQLSLTPEQNKQLHEGKVVFDIGEELQFLNLVMARKSSYKKIPNSSLILRFDFYIPEEVIANYMQPSLNQITSILKKIPKVKWPEKLKRLSSQFSYPIKLIDNSESSLSTAITKPLDNYSFAFTTKSNTSQIDTLYYKFDDAVVKIGPLKYLNITTRISDIIYYFVLAFFSGGFLFIFFLCFLFVRNMRRIYLITDKFSRGQFNCQTKVRTSSVLYGLYRNVTVMGKRLHGLIESNKKLCRFIAHEIRTPLSTIQMTTDSLKRKNSTELQLLRKISSVQEDVGAINQIVKTFLIYSKMQTSELVVKKETVDLIAWLKALLVPFGDSKFTLIFDNNGLGTLTATIDKSILAHAVNNLITNAMKFASSTICITILHERDAILIHVDDDGPGFDNGDTDMLFAEFNTGQKTSGDEKHIGLGLAIVKMAVTLHDGQVFAGHSPRLSGARFTIQLE